MNHEQGYTKARLSADSPFLSEFSLKEISRAKSTLMIAGIAVKPWQVMP